MKIAVIAASGRSGQIFVKQALAKGHHIRAGVRRLDSIPPQPNLELVTCDATKEDDIFALIEGCDAVASFIGHTKGSPANLQTQATAHIIAAMQKAKIRRVISLTGTGVRYPGDNITILDRILNSAVSIIDPARVTDGINHARLLEQSDLEWTIIRVLKLENFSFGEYHVNLNGPAKTIVNRVEVGEAALTILEKKLFVTKSPIISSRE
jgi:putative NADH-flavin reductase